MGLFDGYQFAPQSYGGQGGGLLDLLSLIQSQPMSVSQGQFPQAPQEAYAQAPQAPAPPAPRPEPGIGDRLSAGFQGFANARGLLPALSGAMQGFQAGEMPQNVTVRALVAKGLDPDLARSVAGNPDLMKAVIPHIMGLTGQTDDIKEFEYAKRAGFKGGFEEWMRQKKGGAGEVGLQGIWGVGPDGKPSLIQLGRNGEAVQTKLPPGFSPYKDGQKVDLGTHWGILDPTTRQVTTTIPKDIIGRERDEKVGAAIGTAQVALPAAESTAKRALTMLDQLEKHAGLSDATGFILGRLPALTPKAADFRERVEQIDAMVFGDAVEVMRGLGALTDKEGPKVTAARARLKTAKSEEDFRQAIKDVREVFNTGIENARAKARQAPAASDDDGWQDVGNGVKIRKR